MAPRSETHFISTRGVSLEGTWSGTVWGKQDEWSTFPVLSNTLTCYSLDSEEADKLEELKKVTNEENIRTNKRRMKFQAQDSVLVDTFGGSQEE